MRIDSIKINNYKSISTEQIIPWSQKGIMTFVGKNGSGKTSLLESIAAIFDANSANYHGQVHVNFNYIVTVDCNGKKVQLYYEKGDAALHRVNRIKSEYYINEIVGNQKDFDETVKQLLEKMRQYKILLGELCTDELDSRDFCIDLEGLNNNTNFQWHMKRIKDNVERKTDDIDEFINKHILDGDVFKIDYLNMFPMQNYELKDYEFKLKCVPAKLSKLEQQYITIDSNKIEKAVNIINKKSEKLATEINDLIKKLATLVDEINKLTEKSYIRESEENEKEKSMLEKLLTTVNRRCFFLRDGNTDTLFPTEPQYGHRTNINEQLIIEAYLKFTGQLDNLDIVMKGNLDSVDRNKLKIGLENMLNSSIPEFDKGVHIKVDYDANNKLLLQVVEKSGTIVALNNTSAGRRWYYTYKFIKDCLTSGDVFIIDEPATYLHPRAQTEVLKELEFLSEKDINVIISTHSPYMISDKSESYFRVSMSNTGTILDVVNMKGFDKVREEVGYIKFSDLILDADKRHILVEGTNDAAVVEKFVEIFGCDKTKYNVVPMNSADRASKFSEFVKQGLFDYVILLDEDRRIEEERLKRINMNKVVFTGNGTISIEDLFKGIDKDKCLKKSKIDASKIALVEKFTDKTIAAFESLFKKLGIH